MTTASQIVAATHHYRQHYGPARVTDLAAAASPRRNWHTLAEVRSLQAAGIHTATREDVR